MELLAALAVLLLAAGVAGSFLPMVPGALLSITGISVYWWSTGFSSPSMLIVALLYLTALTALAFDLFAGAVGSKAGGASDRTVHMAAVAGILFFFVGGPLGTIIGITAVVFLREYLLTGETKESSRAALYTIVSVLGSALVQGAMTGLTLLIFVLAVLL